MVTRGLPPLPILDFHAERHQRPRQWPRISLDVNEIATSATTYGAYGIFALSAVGLFMYGPWSSSAPVQCKDPRAVIVGDVHGCAKELRTLLRRAKLRPRCDLLYFVGDVIGKGPASVDALRDVRALSLSRKGPAYVGAVLGNHEAGFLRWLDARTLGRTAPPTSHTVEWEKWASALSSAERMWLRELPLDMALPAEFGHVRVVHAGMVPGVAVADQRREDLITIRSLLPNGTGSALPGPRGSASWAAFWRGPEHLVFGHDARRKLQRYPDATGIDSGCVYGGKLTALILHHSPPRLANESAATSLEKQAAQPSVVVPLGSPLQAARCATRAPCMIHVPAQKGSCAKEAPLGTEQGGKKGGAWGRGGKKGKPIIVEERD
jgi:hypothetical protein